MSLRSLIARAKLEVPALLRDAAADGLDRIGRPVVHLPMPPRRLRAGVGRTSAREEYIQAGAVGAVEILGAFCRVADRAANFPCWLDFGAGSGRLARYLGLAGVCKHLVGADIDSPAIHWAGKHLPGTFFVSPPRPPLSLTAESVDVVIAASVFTHFSEEEQFAWLAELARVLRKGGLLFASTHSWRSLELRTDITEGDRDEFHRRGFLYRIGQGPFNDNVAYHSRSYLETRWSRDLILREHREQGLFQYQDLSVWERVEPDRKSPPRE